MMVVGGGVYRPMVGLRVVLGWGSHVGERREEDMAEVGNRSREHDLEWLFLFLFSRAILDPRYFQHLPVAPLKVGGTV